MKRILNFGHFILNEDSNEMKANDETLLELCSKATISDADLVKIKELLNTSGINPNVKDRDGDTALHLASRWDNLKVVQALLNHPKTDPNIQAADGNAALHWASSKGNSQVALELLKHPRININLKNKVGKTALDLATNDEIIVMLSKKVVKNPINYNSLTDFWVNTVQVAKQNPNGNVVRLDDQPKEIDSILGQFYGIIDKWKTGDYTSRSSAIFDIEILMGTYWKPEYEDILTKILQDKSQSAVPSKSNIVRRKSSGGSTTSGNSQGLSGRELSKKFGL